MFVKQRMEMRGPLFSLLALVPDLHKLICMPQFTHCEIFILMLAIAQ